MPCRHLRPTAGRDLLRLFSPHLSPLHYVKGVPETYCTLDLHGSIGSEVMDVMVWLVIFDCNEA